MHQAGLLRAPEEDGEEQGIQEHYTRAMAVEVHSKEQVAVEAKVPPRQHEKQEA